MRTLGRSPPVYLHRCLAHVFKDRADWDQAAQEARRALAAIQHEEDHEYAQEMRALLFEHALKRGQPEEARPWLEELRAQGLPASELRLLQEDLRAAEAKED